MLELFKLGVVLLYLGLTILVLRILDLRIYLESLTASLRAIFQLLIVGSILLAVFNADSAYINALVLAGMITIAAHTSAQRSGLPGVTRVTLLTIAVTSTLVILPMLLFGVFEAAPRFLIPISGMIIGNAMNSTSLALERLDREIKSNTEEIEAYLSLGLDPKAATKEYVKAAITASLIPRLNGLKTTGIVHIPGLMTGMVLSGQDPILAAQLQAILLYLIFIGAAMASLLATFLARGAYFTSFSSLRDL
jgi:putative ABC transport system permease protein